MIMTGHESSNFTPTGLPTPPSRDDLPSLGSAVARYRPADAGALGYVALCRPVEESSITEFGQLAGFLGAAYDPYRMYDDPARPDRPDDFALPPDTTLGRLRARLDLKAAVAGREAFGPAAFDTFYGRAFSLIEAARARRAFRIEEESAASRERYGATKFGRCCLLARRLIEAGTRLVQVTWPAYANDEPVAGPDGSWDTHRNNFPMLRDWRCPVFDRAAAALLADLAARGLLDETLVLAIGEFGRTPRIGAATTMNVGPGGRDHWPHCYTALIAGGGVRGGLAYGESDAYGAFPKDAPVHPFDLVATVYHALGIDPNTGFLDALKRPRRLVDYGGPILGLY
jgi:hypothetical protein